MAKFQTEAVLTSMTEEEFASYHRQQGIEVILHRGRYWKETVFGFYQPLHWMARLTAEQATCPGPGWQWGCQCSLHEEHAGAANGSMPVHLLSNLEGYDGQNLSSNRRNHLRRCRQRAKIVQLIGTELLLEQGYEVYRSALLRTNYRKPLSQEEYLTNLTAEQNNTYKQKWLVLAGLSGDKLGGYLSGYAVNGTAYIQDVYIATEALSTYMGTGLVFEFVQASRRSGEIQEVVYGQHSREAPALCTFKQGMKFPVKHIPVQVQMNPILAKIMRWRYPHKYYRLTGQIFT